MTPTPPFARKMAELAQIEMPFFQMQQHPKYVNRRADSCNFTFGNPHDMPLPGFVAADLQAISAEGNYFFSLNQYLFVVSKPDRGSAKTA